MKRNFPFLIMTLIAIVSIFINIFQYLNPRKILIKNELSKIESSSMISMMFEQEDGSYKEINDNTLPSDEYEFNDEKSKCENGSDIAWDDANKKIRVSAITSDKCYAYFNLKITIGRL